MGESGARAVVPLIRSPLWIPGFQVIFGGAGVATGRVYGLLVREPPVLHPDLVPIVNNPYAGQSQRQHHDLVAPLPAESRGDAVIVVIARDPIGNAPIRHVRHPSVDQLFEVRGGRLVVEIRDEHKVERDRGSGLVILDRQIELCIRFGEDHPRVGVGAIRVLVHEVSPTSQHVVRLALIPRVQVDQAFVIVLGQVGPVGARLVQQPRVLEHVVDGVDPETVHPPVHPERQHVLHLLIQRGAPVIQIRLAGRELVKIVLFSFLVPLPRRTPEDAEPIVGRLPGPVHDPRVPPHVVLVVRFDPLDALLEPRMLVGTVIGHEVEYHLQTERFRPSHEPVEICQSAVNRVHVREVGDVVAEIDLGTLVDGRQPESVRPYVGYVIHPGRDPVQIAYTVPVAVLETPRIDLVHESIFVPVGVHAIDRRRGEQEASDRNYRRSKHFAELLTEELAARRVFIPKPRRLICLRRITFPIIIIIIIVNRKKKERVILFY